MGDAEKLRSLSLFEWWLLIASACFLPLAAVLLKYRGFRRTEQLLASVSKQVDDDGRQAGRVRQVARMVSVAADRGLFNAQCLEQAITLWWFLGIMGLNSSMRFGIYKQGDQVEAHAWVIYEDEIMIGQLQRLDEYTPLLDVTFDRGKS